MMTALSISTAQPPANTQAVVVSLFGSFKVAINGQSEVHFRSNKARALLAYLLVVHPQPVLRLTLSELLWPGYNPESARVNLRQTLANLRDSLAPYELLQADRTQVRLIIDAATVRCDVLLFNELLAACQHHAHHTINQCLSCQARLQQAVALYQRPFLENFATIDSPAFAEWVQAQRTSFVDRYAEAQALLAPARKPHGNLPPPLTPLIGRAQEVTDLTVRLGHTVYRCVSLVGPSGIGKTRLACAVGEQRQAYFSDGVWLVPLGALAPTTAAETPEQLHDRIATAIAMTIGCTLRGASHPAHQVTTYLANKTALLILDSFEHLTAGAAWLPTVLAAAPHLRLLITTCHRLPLQSQIVYQVGGLALPPEASTIGAAAHLIAQYASVQLFVERAESAQLPLPLSPSTLAAISQLCRFVDGSPWAIEVTVRMLDHYTPADLLLAIQNNSRTLAADLLDLPARQRSAEAVFLAAWRLLTPLEAQTLTRCAVFRGGFTLNAAQTVATATPAILEALVQKSLLQPSGAERYAMHGLVRQFAGEQLAQDEVTAQRCYAAHAAYFATLLATWQPDDAAIHRFRTAVTQDWENVQAAWAWAVETGAIACLQQGLDGLAEFYNLVELFVEADAILGRTLDRVRLLLDAATAAGATAADRRVLQTLLAHLLWRHCYFVNDALAETARAAPLAQELLALAQELGDGALAARGYYELGMIAHFQGESQREEQLLLHALVLAQQEGTSYDQIVCLNLLGLNCHLQGNSTVALRYFQQALALTQHGSYAYYDLMVLNNMGSLLVETGHFSAALVQFQQSLPRAVAAAFNSKIALITASLGEIALLVGDYAAAHTQLTEAHHRYVELHDHFVEAEILNMLAMLFAEMGDDATAQSYAQRALASPGGHIYTVQHRSLCMLGHLYRRQAKWDAAASVYQQALALSQNVNRATDALLTQTYLAAVTLARGEATAALAAVAPLLTNFATTPFTPQQRPQELLLIAYQILVANADSRAQAVLSQAWAYVQEQAAKIDDARLRHCFLTNVPVNRQLTQLVEAQAGGHRESLGRASRQALG